MDPALQKTFTFLAFIILGLLLRNKFGKEQVNGIKTLILTVALPSTIFVALMGVEINANMLVLPFLALFFNFIIYFLTPTVLKVTGIEPNSPQQEP